MSRATLTCQKTLASVCITVLAVLTPSNLCGETLIFDDFNDGQYNDNNPGTWTPQRQNPLLDASSGDLSIIQGSRSGGATWDQTIDGDVSAQTRARIVDGLLGVATKFGGGSGNDGYYFWIPPDGDLSFLSRVNGVEYPIDPNVNVGVVRDQDVFLQLDVVGNRVAGWFWTESSGVPTAPQFEATLTGQPLIDSGLAGFYVSGGQSILRYAHLADSPIPEPSAGYLLCMAIIVVSTPRKMCRGIGRLERGQCTNAGWQSHRRISQ